MKRKVSSIFMLIALLAGSVMTTACDGNTLKFVRGKVADIEVLLDQGYSVIDEFKAEGALTEELAAKGKEALDKVKSGAKIARDQIEGYRVIDPETGKPEIDPETGDFKYKFDGKSKKDLAKAFASVLEGVQQFERESPELAEAVIKALDEKGVIKTDNPEALAARVRVVAKGLTTVVKLVQNHLN
jgi:DNA-directed RNA polymerase specialized sigma54-like protein